MRLAATIGVQWRCHARTLCASMMIGAFSIMRGRRGFTGRI
jgi:hypothetical protein